MRITTLALFAFVLTFSGLSHAQQKKQPIEVICHNNTNDVIGARFCSDVLDEIAKFQRYKIVSTGPHYEVSLGSHWILHITTTGDVLHPNGISSHAGVLTIDFNRRDVFSGEVFIGFWAFQSRADTVKAEAGMLTNRVDAEIQVRTYKGDKKCVLDLNATRLYSSGCPFDLRDSRTDQP